MSREKIIDVMTTSIYADLAITKDWSKYVADHAFTALEAAGYAIVPVEPTEKMVGSAYRVAVKAVGATDDEADKLTAAYLTNERETWTAQYRAMLQSAKGE